MNQRKAWYDRENWKLKHGFIRGRHRRIKGRSESFLFLCSSNQT